MVRVGRVTTLGMMGGEPLDLWWGSPMGMHEGEPLEMQLGAPLELGTVCKPWLGPTLELDQVWVTQLGAVYSGGTANPW